LRFGAFALGGFDHVRRVAELFAAAAVADVVGAPVGGEGAGAVAAVEFAAAFGSVALGHVVPTE
jgi:hypothetical protein